MIFKINLSAVVLAFCAQIKQAIIISMGKIEVSIDRVKSRSVENNRGKHPIMIVNIFLLSLVIFSKSCMAVSSDLFLVSSLRTASSFIYRSGSKLTVSKNTRDIWKICPHSMPTSQCYRDVLQTKDCTVLTSDCRCYNWIVVETAYVKQQGDCVYVDLPLISHSTKITWELDYTYPVLPQGYSIYLDYLYRRLYYKKLSLENFQTIMTPLVCDSAENQKVLEPAFDLCIFEITLNIDYDYVPENPIIIVKSVGPDILIVLIIIAIVIYGLFFLKVEPTKKKN